MRTLKIMFGTIRKHQSWLWGLIIVGIIASMSIYLTPGGCRGGNQGSTEGNFGSIDGEKISKADYINASREASLAYFLSTGQWPETSARGGYDPQRETYQRLFFIKKIKDYNIQVDSDSVAQAAKNILSHFGKNGPVPLDVFLQQGLGSRVTADDFERYLRHQLALQQLISIISVSGELITPQEAKDIYIRDNQAIAAQVVFYSGSNYQTSVTTPTPEALKEFYTNQLSQYRIQDRVQVTYVSFEASNFLAEADKEIAGMTNLNLIVDQIYDQRGTNFYSEAKSPEEAKRKIRAELHKEVELGQARKKADEFATKLFDQTPVRAENLAQFAQASGLKVKTSAPFEATATPAEFEGVPNLTKEAFKLTAEEPFAGPLTGDNAVYVLALLKNLPAQDPSFETVRDRVLADYKHMQATATARRAGSDFARAVTNGLAAGKTFAAICADAKVKPVSLPPISMASLGSGKLPEIGEQVSLYQFSRVAFETPPGKASDFSPTSEGGFLVYVRERLPIDQAKMNADLPETMNKIRQSRRQEVINAWLQREGSKSLHNTPLMQKKPSLLPNEERS